MVNDDENYFPNDYGNVCMNFARTKSFCLLNYIDDHHHGKAVSRDPFAQRNRHRFHYETKKTVSINGSRFSRVSECVRGFV